MTRNDYRLLVERTWLLGLAALPLLFLYLIYRRVVQGRPTAALGSKLTGKVDRPEPGRVLVHGVSMGEVALMKVVVPAIEARSSAPCTLTSTTTTGFEALSKAFPEHHRVAWPFDLPWAVERFLSRVKPRAVVLMEIELWPVYLAACHRRGIPVLVLNGRMSAKSYRGYRKFRATIGPLMRPLALVLAQRKEWGQRFSALGCPRVEVPGSLKADLVQPADDAAITAERTRLQLDDRPVLLFASTSAPEEDRLLAALARLPGLGKAWRLIICPRHPERGGDIAASCRRHELPVARTGPRADAPRIDENDVIIVDEIGRLGALYGIADIAIVGGSLGSGRGSQNVWESAAAGTCTVVGTDTRNFPDAIAALEAADAIKTIDPTDANGTRDIIRALMDAPAERAEMGERGRRAWSGAGGALDRTLDVLAREPTLGSR